MRRRSNSLGKNLPLVPLSTNSWNRLNFSEDEDYKNNNVKLAQSVAQYKKLAYNAAAENKEKCQEIFRLCEENRKLRTCLERCKVLLNAHVAYLGGHVASLTTVLADVDSNLAAQTLQLTPRAGCSNATDEAKQITPIGRKSFERGKIQSSGTAVPMIQGHAISKPTIALQRVKFIPPSQAQPALSTLDDIQEENSNFNRSSLNVCDSSPNVVAANSPNNRLSDSLVSWRPQVNSTPEDPTQISDLDSSTTEDEPHTSVIFGNLSHSSHTSPRTSEYNGGDEPSTSGGLTHWPRNLASISQRKKSSQSLINTNITATNDAEVSCEEDMSFTECVPSLIVTAADRSCEPSASPASQLKVSLPRLEDCVLDLPKCRTAFVTKRAKKPHSESFHNEVSPNLSNEALKEKGPALPDHSFVKLKRLPDSDATSSTGSPPSPKAGENIENMPPDRNQPEKSEGPGQSFVLLERLNDKDLSTSPSSKEGSSSTSVSPKEQATVSKTRAHIKQRNKQTKNVPSSSTVTDDSDSDCSDSISTVSPASSISNFDELEMDGVVSSPPRRVRRAKQVPSYKEPSLHKKLRRE